MKRGRPSADAIAAKLRPKTGFEPGTSPSQTAAEQPHPEGRIIPLDHLGADAKLCRPSHDTAAAPAAATEPVSLRIQTELIERFVLPVPRSQDAQQQIQGQQIYSFDSFPTSWFSTVFMLRPFMRLPLT